MNSHQESHERKTAGILLCIPVFAVILLQYVQLEFSAADTPASAFHKSFPVLLCNIILVIFINLLLYLIFHRAAAALLLTDLLFGFLSLLNYYVIMLHGSPAYLTEIKSAETGMNVMGEYAIELDHNALILLGISVMEALLILLPCLVRRRHRKGIFREIPRKQILPAFLASFAVTLVIIFGEFPISGEAITWAWKPGIDRFGYPAAFAKSGWALFHPIKKPAGYSPEAVIRPAEEEASAGNGYPDLIVILNESFCDLNDYLDLKADGDFMHGFYTIENSCTGHAVSALTGGGTNNSEFELLTGNSLYLLNISAPFTYLDFHVSDNSIPRYLKKLGYHTIGMHCGDPVNYNRVNAYPALGFDESILGPDSFALRYNGNRPWLDADNYDDLLRFYDAAGDGPRFVYLLSYMNHGGYDQNDPSLDTVHTGLELGKLTDQVNEYLSSMSLASLAFEELTQRLKERERPVIVLMVGDHAPTFIQELPGNPLLSPGEQEIAMRTVPFILWSNAPVDFPEQASPASMTDLMPLMLRTAGIPLSSYYRLILSLHEELPIRTSYGAFVTKDGSIGSCTEDSPWQKELRDYYYLEYNALEGGDDYAEEAFSPPGASP